MDELRFDTVIRSLALAQSRRAALAALAALGFGGVDVLAKKKKKKDKKKNKCKTGPCNYDQCLLYVQEMCSDSPSIARGACIYALNVCCDFYALSLKDKAYRNAVLTCFQTR